MQKLIACLFTLGLLVAGKAHAELQGRLPATPGGDDYQAVYDTELNVLWLTDAMAGAGSSFDDGADPNDGLMTWSSARAWASNLNVAGVTGWRLPSTSQPDSTCASQDCSGGSCVGSGLSCMGSELGHLFYVALGGTAGRPITSSTHPDIALFRNLGGAEWWSGTTFAPIDVFAWSFQMSTGRQTRADKESDERFAIAVRDGDWPPKIPNPPTLAR